jgi:CheY-like chemotaxis protein
LNHNLKNKKILIVDDDDINQMVLSGMLKKKGYQYDTASNGYEALEKINQTEFAVIIMDCLMPELNGFEATRRIRKMEQTGELNYFTPIIAVTAKTKKVDIERCLKAGMDDFIGKPVQIETLVAIIQKHIS